MQPRVWKSIQSNSMTIHEDGYTYYCMILFVTGNIVALHAFNKTSLCLTGVVKNLVYDIFGNQNPIVGSGT